LAGAIEVVEAPTVLVAAISPAAGEGIEMRSVEALAVPVGITAPARDPVEAVVRPVWDPEAVEEAAVAVVAADDGDSLRIIVMRRVSRTTT
jgi:hypothetical protein